VLALVLVLVLVTRTRVRLDDEHEYESRVRVDEYERRFAEHEREHDGIGRLLRQTRPPPRKHLSTGLGTRYTVGLTAKGGVGVRGGT